MTPTDAAVVGDGGGALDIAADISASGCVSDSQCGDPTPRCDVKRGQCVQCIPWDDHCLGGAWCNSAFQCVDSCQSPADCYVPDGGAPLQCCNGVCVAGGACVDGGALAGSCKELLAAQPMLLSGTYTIQLGASPVQVYCDMITQGGGWTRITYPQFSDLQVSMLLGAAGRQMMKCSDDDASNYVVSPQVTSWSWSPGMFVQVPGTWIVDGQQTFCGNNPEFTTIACSTWFGVGCGNGPGGTTKLFPGVNAGGGCADRTSASINGAFLVCGGGAIDYRSWSTFVRAGD